MQRPQPTPPPPGSPRVRRFGKRWEDFALGGGAASTPRAGVSGSRLFRRRWAPLRGKRFGDTVRSRHWDAENWEKVPRTAVAPLLFALHSF